MTVRLADPKSALSRSFGPSGSARACFDRLGKQTPSAFVRRFQSDEDPSAIALPEGAAICQLCVACSAPPPMRGRVPEVRVPLVRDKQHFARVPSPSLRTKSRPCSAYRWVKPSEGEFAVRRSERADTTTVTSRRSKKDLRKRTRRRTGRRWLAWFRTSCACSSGKSIRPAARLRRSLFKRPGMARRSSTH